MFGLQYYTNIQVDEGVPSSPAVSVGYHILSAPEKGWKWIWMTWLVMADHGLPGNWGNGDVSYMSIHELHLSMAMKPCVGPPLFKSGSNRVNLHTSAIQHHWVSGTKSWLSHGYGPKPHRFTAGWKALWKFRVKDAQQLDACDVTSLHDWIYLNTEAERLRRYSKHHKHQKTINSPWSRKHPFQSYIGARWVAEMRADASMECEAFRTHHRADIVYVVTWMAVIVLWLLQLLWCWAADIWGALIWH